MIGDIAREAVSEVLELLRATGVESSGAIALDEVALSLSPDNVPSGAVRRGLLLTS
ncbi:hypothetical protein [Lacisediminihabitans sp. H27-G8]|uniref:hypothetical protein n=1 Tax=Lacisediminihabitans sp. H27-G8 TaxID=3111909 RepID=UPI0038FCAE65